MSFADAFRRIVEHLNQCNLNYMVVGSFASAYYSSPRSTADLDVVIEATLEQLKRLVETLQASDYYAELDAALDALRHESFFNVLDNRNGWKIDFILLKSRPFDREEFSRRVAAKLSDIQLFVASAEDVILSKLEWSKLGGSLRQIEDVAKVIAAQWNTLDKDYLSKWIGELELQQQWAAAKRSAEIPD
jgi:hypothetical protein